jgi:hypothetical protein
MRNLDFSSWQAMLFSFVGLALVTLIGVVIRLVLMQSVQARRDRENRQINERLRTLIAAYKTLGGSFTGSLEVDPRHKRDLKAGADPPDGDRTRRIRDAAESALSDIILLGTEDQVQLAARASSQLVAGHTVETAELVVSLRDFIRKSLHLAPIPPGLAIPRQGPTRVIAKNGGKDEGKNDGGLAGGMMGGLFGATGQEEDHEASSDHR